jgi:hypothetical protein
MVKATECLLTQCHSKGYRAQVQHYEPGILPSPAQDEKRQGMPAKGGGERAKHV